MKNEQTQHLPSPASGRNCCCRCRCCQETLVRPHWSFLEAAGTTQSRRTQRNPVDEAARVCLWRFLVKHELRKMAIPLVSSERRFSPNLLRISCCSSRVEKRILGLRPLVWKPSQGGGLVLGLSLGSTSMFRLTWNRSGYFSWMSQASRSYLAGPADKEGGAEGGGREKRFKCAE